MSTSDTIHGEDDDRVTEVRGEADIDPLSMVITREGGRGAILEVSQLWGDAWLGTRRFDKPGRAVRLGSSEEGADFLVPGEGGRELVRWLGDRPVVAVDATWDGFADIDGQRLTFDALTAMGRAGREPSGWSVPVDPGMRVVIEVGGMVFLVQRVAAGRRVAAPLAERIDWPFLSIASAVGLAGLVFGALLRFLPAPPVTDLSEEPDRILIAQLQEREKVPAGGVPDEGERAKKAEGKMGAPDAKMKRAKGQKTKADRDREIVENAGAMGAFSDDATMAALSGSFAPGMADGVGGLIGARGTQLGSAGLGQRGTGLGNGGKAEGIDGLGLHGPGPGDGGTGGEGSRWGGKKDGVIADSNEAVTIGHYDKSLVDEVVKRHMSAIRYCYQREMQRQPDLSGKVVVRFTIANDGSVSSSSTKSSSMGNAAVEGCIAGRFLGMTFPAPKAGIVIVSYPFLFAPAR